MENRTIAFDDIVKANESIKTTPIKGKQYAEVNQRIKAFRMLYPQGTIKTNIVSLENGVVTMQSSVYDGDLLLATGYAQEKESTSYINKTSFIENCETSAVGRALGMCGFGIDVSIASFEEVTNAISQQEQEESKPKGNKSKAQPKEQSKSQPQEQPTAEDIIQMYHRLVATMDSFGIDFRNKHNAFVLRNANVKTQDVTALNVKEVARLNTVYNHLIKSFKEQKGA